MLNWKLFKFAIIKKTLSIYLIHHTVFNANKFITKNKLVIKIRKKMKEIFYNKCMQNILNLKGNYLL